MPITYTSSSTNSNLNSADVSIVVSPSSGVINATNLLPGDSVQGIINVSNTGNVDQYYYITASWKGSGTTTDHRAAILAYYLNVSVTASPSTVLYTGNLAGLIDQPASPGQPLPLTTGNEDVVFDFILPSTVGSVINDIDMSIDFIFVATA